MTIVKINALEIPPQAGDEIVKRFTARLDSLADVAGFEGFELLRPTADTETRWFVYTRWADQAAYEAWRDGEGARRSHAEQETGEG
ncbi:MAG: antibiotic biosynthesis monooxygenase family protein, partial [Acidimicrobiales bacterium]